MQEPSWNLKPPQQPRPILSLVLFWLLIFSAVYAALWVFHG